MATREWDLDTRGVKLFGKDRWGTRLLGPWDRWGTERGIQEQNVALGVIAPRLSLNACQMAIPMWPQRAISRAVATTRDHAPFPQAHPLAMDPWMADPDSWQDMGAMVVDWMGEQPAGGMGELDDNLRALDSHAESRRFAMD